MHAGMLVSSWLINNGIFADKRIRLEEAGAEDSTLGQAATLRKTRDPGPMLGLVHSAHPKPAYDPTGKVMKEVWLWLMRPPNKGILPSTISTKQHRTLINKVDSWYRPLALDSQLAILRDPTSDHGHCLRIIESRQH